jgi:F420-0:gamma-glutamyl ligase-like protein
MSRTLLEGAIVVVLLWIAWCIGSMLAPWIGMRLRKRRSSRKSPPDQKNKPPYIIDI